MPKLVCLKINSEFKKKNLEGYIIIDDRDSQNYMYIYLKIRYFETFFDDKITKKKYHRYFLLGGGEGGVFLKLYFHY